jgi:acetyl-CoA C-acetyltransferase/acetyl-CoA acyltransferase 2
MSESKAKSLGLKPLARIVSYASVGCDPTIMGIGPAGAARKALEMAGLKLEQMDLVEVNEAFAAQYLAVEKELKLNPEKTNVNGGPIAVGHPLGASGTRIMNHLVYELHRRNAKYALGSACIGGGQGIAIIIEKM